MGKIEKILKKGPVEGQTTEVYPVTSTKAVYDENNKRLDNIITGLQESVYLNTPIPISTENTTESMAQNVKNITDYVKKAKAAGIADVNGMAVTCLIDNFFSGVGYIMGNTDVAIQGIKIPDDLIDNVVFTIHNGRYDERFIVGVDEEDKVTSDMLVQGARKPIILTPDTTEVDEETYQKLLSDDVDVVFKASGDEFCIPTYKSYTDTEVMFYFNGLSLEGEAGTDDLWLYSFFVSISKNNPHTFTVQVLNEDEFSRILYKSGYLNKSYLNPILWEIDLRGTDADRKAKLDQFETDWKALTGASDLSNSGARFMGRYMLPDDGTDITGVLSYDNAGTYVGIFGALGWTPYKVEVSTNGSLTITPLFSHLEAITIYTDNTPEHMQANLANINAYEANLQALGVDTTKSPMIPCGFQNYSRGWITKSSTASGGEGHLYVGIARDENGAPYTYFILVNPTGKYSKYDAINSGYINNNFELGVVGVQANAKSLEAVTIKTSNTPEDKAANVAAINAYIDNLTALGVDVTKGYMIPVKLNNGYHGFIMGTGADGNHTGIIKMNTYSYGGGWIFIDNIGTYQYLECLTLGSYDLTTTAKTIVPAINEVNALTKGYSTIFTPIELTTETAQNKTAIDARVAAFTAQGISLTNGCCIPVTYKGVYTGNISLINGDWYGLLVKNTNNPADNINIKLSADGTITEGNSV